MAKKDEKHSTGASRPAAPHSARASPAPPPVGASKPPVAGGHPTSSGLTLGQKAALVAAAILIGLVLAFALPSASAGADPAVFTRALYDNPRSGIIMDVRDAPSAAVATKVMQCGINLISSGFYVQSKKDLLVYACDATGCLSSTISPTTGLNTTNSTLNATTTTVPFSDALWGMRGRPYFLIHGGNEERKTFSPTSVDVQIGPESDPSQCSIALKTG